MSMNKEELLELFIETSKQMSQESDRCGDLIYTQIAGDGKKIIRESEVPFYSKQKRLLLADNSRIDPNIIDDYLAIGGYMPSLSTFFCPTTLDGSPARFGMLMAASWPAEIRERY